MENKVNFSDKKMCVAQRPEDILNGDDFNHITLPGGEQKFYRQNEYIGDWRVIHAVSAIPGNIPRIPQNPYKSALVIGNISDVFGEVRHDLPNLSAGDACTLMWNDLALSPDDKPLTRGGFSLIIRGNLQENSAEPVVIAKKDCLVEDGIYITNEWNRQNINFEVTENYTDVTLTLQEYKYDYQPSAWLLITNMQLLREEHPVSLNIEQQSPEQLVLVSDGTGNWVQQDQWTFSVSDVNNPKRHPKDGTVVTFSTNFSPDTTHAVKNGKVTLPVGTVTTIYKPHNPVLTVNVQGSEKKFAINVSSPITRLIITPAIASLRAPVEGVFSQDAGIRVLVEELNDSRNWIPKTNARIVADLETKSGTAPCFPGGEHHFAGQMKGKEDVILPTIQAGVHAGDFILTLSDADNRQISDSLILTVDKIAKLDLITPLSDGTSRKWVTEPGRWKAQARLKNGEVAMSQPVVFRLESDPAMPGLEFKESKDITLAGHTDGKGVAWVPAINVPNVSQSFSVFIEAGDDVSAPAQAVVEDITISDAQAVHTIDPLGWTSTMLVQKPQDFSVQLKDIEGHPVTSGRFAEFRITQNTAGAKFKKQEDTGVAVSTDDDTDKVPACWGDGQARITCREIECSNAGVFTLTVISPDKNAPGVQQKITVTA